MVPIHSGPHPLCPASREPGILKAAPEAVGETPVITGHEEAHTQAPPPPQGPSSLSLGAGAVALRQCLEVHGEGLLFGLGGPLPFGASQDVEHDQSKASQQQPQHVGQDTLGLKRAVLGPAGSGWKGEATPGVTIRPHATHA